MTVQNPHGGGKRKITNIATDCWKKLSIIPIPRNKDNLCCARAISVGMACLENDPLCKSIKDGRWLLQKRMAEQLHLDTGIPREMCGFPEIRKFEDHLHAQIHVVFAMEFNKVSYNFKEILVIIIIRKCNIFFILSCRLYTKVLQEVKRFFYIFMTTILTQS